MLYSLSLFNPEIQSQKFLISRSWHKRKVVQTSLSQRASLVPHYWSYIRNIQGVHFKRIILLHYLIQTGWLDFVFYNYPIKTFLVNYCTIKQSYQFVTFLQTATWAACKPLYMIFNSIFQIYCVYPFNSFLSPTMLVNDVAKAPSHVFVVFETSSGREPKADVTHH